MSVSVDSVMYMLSHTTFLVKWYIYVDYTLNATAFYSMSDSVDSLMYMLDHMTFFSEVMRVYSVMYS